MGLAIKNDWGVKVGVVKVLDLGHGMRGSNRDAKLDYFLTNSDNEM